MANATKNFSKEELILLLEKGTATGWWDKEVHKISFKIVSELIMFSSEVEDTQENCVRRALFGLDDNIVLRAETKIFNIKKRLIGTLTMKIITHVRSMKDFTVVNHVILLVINVIMLV